METIRRQRLETVGLIITIVGLSIIGQVGFLLSLVLILLYYKRKKFSRSQLGLSKPNSWIKVILKSIGLSLIIILLIRSLDPLIFSISGKPSDLTRFDGIKENPVYLISTLIFVWLTAGFGEEILWRGFIMKRIAELFGDNQKGWFLSLVISSVLFGCIHLYQGLSGVIQTGLAGFFLGLIYWNNGKHGLWLNILTHGFINTISLIYIYLK